MLALAVLLTAATVLTWIAASADHAQPAAEETEGAAAIEDAAAAARVAATLDRSGKDLLSTLHVNFDLATRGADPRKSRMMDLPRDNSAGLVCNPADLDPDTSTFRIVLPAAPADRKGVLAALTPDGSLRIIYISYGIDTDPEDLIIPSRSIDWERVRTRNDFVADAGEFEALHPDKDRPEPLFRQAGVYQFALVNGIDRELLEVNGAAFWVKAGCVVRWQP